MKAIIECCDCVDGMRGLADGCIDLTVTSPPYDNLRTYNGFSWDFEAVARELFRVTKHGGVVVWIVNDATIKGSETGTSFRQALYFMECGFLLHDTMIWDKGSFTATGSLVSRYAPVFEYMFVLSKGKPVAFNPINDKPNKTAGAGRHGPIRQKDGSFRAMSNCGKPIATFGRRHNVWAISADMRRGAPWCKHPARFPERIANDHVLSWSNPGDTVLDPFAGSGTTGKVALEIGRNFVGFEISEEYAEMAKARIAACECFASLDERS